MTYENDDTIVKTLHANIKKFHRACKLSVISTLIVAIAVFLSAQTENELLTSSLMTLGFMLFLGLFLGMVLLGHYLFYLNIPALKNQYKAIRKHHNNLQNQQ